MTKREEEGSDDPSEVPATPDGEVSKAELQRRMDEARESISQTVEEIKETVEDQYESVRATVTGILDWREQFQKDPIIWSVGALSAGFALGYTLGRAQQGSKSAGGKRSELAAFTDSLVAELGDLARHLPIPAFDPKMKELFGFGLSDVIAEMGGTAAPKSIAKPQAKPRAKASRRASAAKRRPTAKPTAKPKPKKRTRR